MPKLGRRSYVIDRGFQLKYIVVLTVVGVGVSALFGAMMFLTHVDAVRDLKASGGLTIPPLLQETWERSEQTMIALTAGMAVLMGAALSLFGVLITHRVAGPVYVMTRYITLLSQGQYPIMRSLRKTDELRAFFERFQEAIESMRMREASEAQALEQVLKTLAALPTTPEMSASCESLQALYDRKRGSVARAQEPASRPAA